MTLDRITAILEAPCGTSFVLLPGLFGFTASKLVDRLAERPTRYGLPWVALGAAAVVLILIGTEGAGSIGLVLAVLLAVFVGWLASTRLPKLRRIPSYPPVVWIVRAVMLAAGLFAARALAKDVARIL